MRMPYRELVLQYNEAPLLSSVLASDAPCAGKGKCGKCRVRVRGKLSEVTDAERALLDEGALAQGWRLACQARALGDIEVDLPIRQQMAVQLDFVRTNAKAAGGQSGVALAVDIGTTTIAAYACDLQTGEILARGARENAQRAYGADVISRVEIALSGGLSKLSAAVRSCVDTLLCEVAQKAGIAPSDFARAAVTGNSCMLLLLCGEMPSALAAAPFALSRLFGETLRARTLFPSLPDACALYLPKCISAFVGADITCALLSADMPEDGSTLLCDIGTNGEIALLAHGKLTVCSTAAGPAFEGAGVSCGGPARPGAIDRVWLDSASAIAYHVIGECQPTHFCGSGLVDAVAVWLETGAISESGRVEGDTRIADVRMTQADIRAIQLAKSAICAGMLTLLWEAGIAQDTLDTLLIAGGFGAKMNVQSARRIGLIPDGTQDKAIAIGNAAGAGAVMLALDNALVAPCEAIAARASVVELSTNKTFMNAYVEQMLFPEE